MVFSVFKFRINENSKVNTTIITYYLFKMNHSINGLKTILLFFIIKFEINSYNRNCPEKVNS